MASTPRGINNPPKRVGLFWANKPWILGAAWGPARAAARSTWPGMQIAGMWGVGFGLAGNWN